MKEWITGRNPVYETLRARRRQVFRLQFARGIEETNRLKLIRHLADLRQLPVEQVERRKLDQISESHQGVALETSGYRYAVVQDIIDYAQGRAEALFVLALDMIQNPQNLGTLLRTADAVGVHGVLIPLARTAGVTPAVVHASSGASEHLLIAPVNLAQAFEQLKGQGAWIAGLEGTGQSQPIGQVRLDGPLVMVVGNEGEGMRSLVRKSCDVLVSLPTVGQVASLNAAVAGSIGLYLAMQARNSKK